MIATAARPSEALHCRWSEINLEKRLWTVPKARMKSNREHIAPLSALALEVLDRRALVRAGDNVFLRGDRAARSAIRASPSRRWRQVSTPEAGIAWRTFFSDWRGNTTSFPRELVEFALAHAVPGVAGDYQRESAPIRQVELMAAYSRWLTGAEAEVIAFPARA